MRDVIFLFIFRNSEYLKIIENSGFMKMKVHKQKEITLPDWLLSGYSDDFEIKSFHPGETGIFSLTISAERPSGCSCGGIC